MQTQKTIVSLYYQHNDTAMSEVICSTCHYIGKPKLVKKESNAFRIFSWVTFPFGYVFYYIWRLFNQHNACSQCGSTMLVNKNTPLGRRLISIYAPGMEEVFGVEPVETKPKVILEVEKKFTIDDFINTTSSDTLTETSSSLTPEKTGEPLASTRVKVVNEHDPSKPHEW
jgi:hypothetical protein